MLAALFSDRGRAAPLELVVADLEEPTGGSGWSIPALEALSSVYRLPDGPTGLGTATVHLPRAFPATEPDIAALMARPAPAAPVGADPVDEDSGTELYCPPAVRDDVALGEAVNERLVQWAEQVGIYPGRLDKVRSANFGRLIMLTHPGSDDPDRLLAAAKCILAEWSTDDHMLDEESLGADATTIGGRLGVTYASVDPVYLPAPYDAQLQEALDGEPVSVAYQSAFDHLARYASDSQLARLHHELAVMFVAYSMEATWRTSGRVPAVWEYLEHRYINSFLPPMVLVDPVASYEIPAQEFADGRVRRVFATAGLASVVLNDLYSMSTESDTDFDLPKIIAAEEGCSPAEAITRSVRIHNELMHTYEREASVLSAAGSPLLRRFLADIWAWLGGNREWHATTARYREMVDA
jgi:2-methylisoborneol synthase